MFRMLLLLSLATRATGHDTRPLLSGARARRDIDSSYRARPLLSRARLTGSAHSTLSIGKKVVGVVSPTRNATLKVQPLPLQLSLADGSEAVVIDGPGLYIVQAACDRSGSKSALSKSMSLLRKQFAENLVGVSKGKDNKNLVDVSKGKGKTPADWSLSRAKAIDECDTDLVWVAWGSSARGVPCAAAGLATEKLIYLEHLVGDTTRTSCKGMGGKLVKEIVKAASKLNPAKDVAVFPSAGWGSTVEGEKKLEEFYKESGFRQGKYVLSTQQASSQQSASIRAAKDAATFWQKIDSERERDELLLAVA